MIRERPGASNDREYVLSNIDNDRHRNFDYEEFGKKYDAWNSCKHNNINADKICNACGETVDK